jgi:hypothetical protein
VTTTLNWPQVGVYSTVPSGLWPGESGLWVQVAPFVPEGWQVQPPDVGPSGTTSTSPGNVIDALSVPVVTDPTLPT